MPLDAIAQAENDKDMRQWEPLNSMLLISSTLAFARYDDKRMWAYDVIENAMTRNLGYSFSEEYDESAEDNEDTNEVGGQPGPRLNYGPTYYAAFVHDPEGNTTSRSCSSERCQLSNNGKDRPPPCAMFAWRDLSYSQRIKHLSSRMETRAVLR